MQALSFYPRLVGLLTRQDLSQDEGIYFPRCNAVHTCFMRFPIMVIFCQSGKIVQLNPYVKPWQFLRYATADSVFEFAVQTEKRHSVWLQAKMQSIIDNFFLGISPKAGEIR